MEAIAGENFKHISLLERLEDLENRSRWANFWIVKIPEGSEVGWDPIEFISELLRDAMGTNVFSKPRNSREQTHTGVQTWSWWIN